ncbi:MAG: DUF3467 domain-containing protein [Candidatus Schekmanbacteria bacterium]|nr:MAG: DUF3467 domain-containing protein [Candidatus Schekmanbacteria bacterium]
MNDEKNRNGKEIQVNIKVEEEIAEGVYSNLAKISHGIDEFTLDFIYINIDPPFGKLRSRIILTPQHAKRLSIALNQHIEKYEMNFGEIKISQDGPDGFNYIQ